MLQFNHILSWYVNRTSLHNKAVACVTCPQVMGHQSLYQEMIKTHQEMIRTQEMIKTHQHKRPPILWSLTNKSINNKSWTWYGEKGTLSHCWWEWESGLPLTETVWKFLRKLKLELSHDPAILLLGTDPEKIIQKRSMHPYYCEQQHPSQQPGHGDTETSINRWADEEHTQRSAIQS